MFASEFRCIIRFLDIGIHGSLQTETQRTCQIPVYGEIAVPHKVLAEIQIEVFGRGKSSQIAEFNFRELSVHVCIKTYRRWKIVEIKFLENFQCRFIERFYCFERFHRLSGKRITVVYGCTFLLYHVLFHFRIMLIVFAVCVCKCHIRRVVELRFFTFNIDSGRGNIKALGGADSLRLHQQCIAVFLTCVHIECFVEQYILIERIVFRRKCFVGVREICRQLNFCFFGQEASQIKTCGKIHLIQIVHSSVHYIAFDASVTCSFESSRKIYRTKVG